MADFFFVCAPEDESIVLPFARALGISDDDLRSPYGPTRITAQARSRATVVWISDGTRSEQFIAEVARALDLHRASGHAVIPVFFVEFYDPPERILQSLRHFTALQFVTDPEDPKFQIERPAVPPGEPQSVSDAAVAAALRSLLPAQPVALVADDPGSGVVAGELDSTPTTRSAPNDIVPVVHADAVVAKATSETTRIVQPPPPRQDLAGRDLHQRDLRYQDLRGADLSNANLQRADLSFAQLDGADMTGANCDGAHFVGTSCLGTRPPDWRPPPETSLGCVHSPRDPVVHVVAAAPSPARCLAWSPFARTAGHLLATGHEDGTVRTLDPARGQMMRMAGKHADIVWSIAWSPDAEWLAVGSTGATTLLATVAHEETPRRLLDPATGAAPRSGRVRSVAWSPDGRFIAAGGDDGLVVVQDARSGQVVGRRRLAASVRWVAWHPSGDRLAYATIDGRLGEWKVASGDHRDVDARSGVNHAAWSLDGQRIATAGTDGKIRLWTADLVQESTIFNGHPSGEISVDWNHDGTMLASGSADGKVRIWSVRDRREVRGLGDAALPVWAVAWSPNGEKVAAASSTEFLHLWDKASSWSVTTLITGTRHRVAMAWNDTRGLLAAASADAPLHVWSFDRVAPAPARAGQSNVQCCAWSPDGRTLATGRSDHTIQLVTETRTDVLQADGPVSSVAWRQDGAELAAAGGGRVQRWSIPWTGSPPRDVAVRGRRVRGLAWGPRGELAVAVDSLVQVWLAPDEAPLIFADHTAAVQSVVWGPDGWLTSGAEDGIVWHCNPRTQERERIAIGSPVTAVARTHDGSLAWGGVDGVLHLRDGRGAVQSHSAHQASLTSVVLVLRRVGDVTVRMLASAAEDGTIRLWRLESATCAVVLHPVGSAWAAFHPTGRYCGRGDLGKTFWHVMGLHRFDVGALDPLVPGIRAPETSPLDSLAAPAGDALGEARNG